MFRTSGRLRYVTRGPCVATSQTEQPSFEQTSRDAKTLQIYLAGATAIELDPKYRGGLRHPRSTINKQRCPHTANASILGSSSYEFSMLCSCIPTMMLLLYQKRNVVRVSLYRVPRIHHAIYVIGGCDAPLPGLWRGDFFFFYRGLQKSRSRCRRAAFYTSNAKNKKHNYRTGGGDVGNYVQYTKSRT